VGALADAVGAIEALRDDAFKAHVAGDAEQILPDVALLVSAMIMPLAGGGQAPILPQSNDARAHP
jgi:hypothetical protein